jgi:hypothetical protein
MGKGNTIEYAYQNMSLEDMEGEEWKELTVFGQDLLFSNMGRVKSPAKPHKPWPNILRQKIHRYLRIKVSVGGGKYKTPDVHPFIGKCFVPNPDNLPEINHKKGDKLDNRASELEWSTHKENCDHAVKIGLNKTFGQSGEKHPHSKLTNVETIEISKSTLSRKEISQKYGICLNHVTAIKNGYSRSSITGIKHTKRCQGN